MHHLACLNNISIINLFLVFLPKRAGLGFLWHCPVLNTVLGTHKALVSIFVMNASGKHLTNSPHSLVLLLLSSHCDNKLEAGGAPGLDCSSQLLTPFPISPLESCVASWKSSNSAPLGTSDPWRLELVEKPPFRNCWTPAQPTPLGPQWWYHCSGFLTFIFHSPQPPAPILAMASWIKSVSR
jgi:hypothetical protein